MQTHATATATVGRPEFLFALSAPRARVTRVRGGYRLILDRPHPGVVRFSDRPDRLADSQSLAAFVRDWKRNGFVADPPNAAIVALGAPAGRDVMVLELRRPRLTRAGLSLHATPVGTPPTSLASFAKRADRPRALRLGPTSLFVDSAPGTEAQYLPITFNISNAQPGQVIGVSLAANGSPVEFSSGPPFQSSGGLRLEALSESLPVTELSLTPSAIRLSTGAGGGQSAISGTLRAYLAAEADAETFSLRSTADPGVEVLAQVGDSQPQIVNRSETLFAWDPS